MFAAAGRQLATSSLRAPAPAPLTQLRLAASRPSSSAARLSVAPSLLRAYSAAAPGDDAKALKDQLMAALKTAMKARNVEETGIIKSLRADITYFEKAPSPPIEATAEQIVKVIQKSIGRRHESAAQYKAADRNDLAEKELKEAEFISSFLPKFMPLEEISPILARLAETLKSEKGSMKAMGGLLGAFYKEVGRTAADSKVVAQAAKDLLGLK